MNATFIHTLVGALCTIYLLINVTAPFISVGVGLRDLLDQAKSNKRVTKRLRLILSTWFISVLIIMLFYQNQLRIY